MARRYSETREYQFPDEATTIRAESVARQVVTQAFAPQEETLSLYVSMDAVGGYESNGSDWDEVLAELSADGLDPTRTYVAFYPGGLAVNPTSISSRRDRADINVVLAGEDEGVVRATAAKLDRLLAPLVGPRSDRPVVQSPAATPAPTILAASTTTATATESEPPPAPEAWLKRTWRDHAAGLVITVVGTVLAALVLAVVFKIGA